MTVARRRRRRSVGLPTRDMLRAAAGNGTWCDLVLRITAATETDAASAMFLFAPIPPDSGDTSGDSAESGSEVPPPSSAPVSFNGVLTPATLLLLHALQLGLSAVLCPAALTPVPSAAPADGSAHVVGQRRVDIAKVAAVARAALVNGSFGPVAPSDADDVLLLAASVATRALERWCQSDARAFPRQQNTNALPEAAADGSGVLSTEVVGESTVVESVFAAAIVIAVKALADYASPAQMPPDVHFAAAFQLEPAALLAHELALLSAIDWRVLVPAMSLAHLASAPLAAVSDALSRGLYTVQHNGM